MIFFHIKKETGKKLLTVFLAVTLIVPAVFAFIPPPQAQATVSSCITGYTAGIVIQIKTAVAAAVLSVPVGTNGQTVAQAGQLGSSLSNFFKDCIEHGLALTIGKMLLSQMTNQIVSYINGGFNGSPAFVGNPGKLFQNIGDRVVANALNGISEGALGINICQPLQAQVLAGLEVNFGYTGGGNGGDIYGGHDNSCSLAKISSNVQGGYQQFTNWQNFLTISLNNDSNPYGAFLDSAENINSQISSQQSTQASELNWGAGFLSQQDCTHFEVNADGGTSAYNYTLPGGNGVSVSATVGGGTTPPPANARASSVYIGPDANNTPVYSDPNNDTCTITTPGKTIADTLQNQLNVPADQLGVADDLDKIFNALFNELLKTGLGALGLGSGGLASAGTSVQNGGSGAWNTIANNAALGDQTATDQASQEANSVSGLIQSASNTQASGSGGSQNGGSPTNVALNASVTAYQTARPGFDASHLTDGDTTMSSSYDQNSFSGAITNPNNAIDNFTIDLGQQVNNLFKVVIYPHNPSNPNDWLSTPNSSIPPPTFKVVMEDQNGDIVWDSLAAGYPAMSTFGGNPYTLTLSQAVGARRVIIQGLTIGGLQLAEAQVYKDNGPVITLSNSLSVSATAGNPLSTYDYGASAIDANGNTTPVTTSYTNQSGATVDANTAIQSGQSYTITYTATDSYGVTSTITRTVSAAPNYGSPTNI